MARTKRGASKMQSGACPWTAGFTLVEILVALMLLTIILVGSYFFTRIATVSSGADTLQISARVTWEDRSGTEQTVSINSRRAR